MLLHYRSPYYLVLPVIELFVCMVTVQFAIEIFAIAGYDKHPSSLRIHEILYFTRSGNVCMYVKGRNRGSAEVEIIKLINLVINTVIKLFHINWA